MRKEVVRKQRESRREARSWQNRMETVTTCRKHRVTWASFLVTCREVEGGNLMLEVRDPLLHCRGGTIEALGGPWR